VKPEAVKQISLDALRKAAAKKNDFSVAAIARRIGKSRWTIYHLRRCPTALQKIHEAYDV